VSDSLLTPELLPRLAELKARAQQVADGLWGGSHRSARHGASVVFSERRPYSPGDDTRLLDWKALARSDRPSIKRFEEEAELEVHLLLDRSASMGFGYAGRPTKLEHGALLLSALAFVVARQRDRVGLAFLDDELETVAPARSQPGHTKILLELLAGVSTRDAGTDLARTLGDFAERKRRRSLVVLATDMLDTRGLPAEAFRVLRARGHELKLLHVVDPAELDFPFRSPARFHGLEGEGEVVADPIQIAEAYAAELSRFLDQARRATLDAHASYALARSDARPEETLGALLSPRSRAGMGRRAWA